MKAVKVPREPETFPIYLTQTQIAHAWLALQAYNETGDCEADDLDQTIAKLGKALALLTLDN
jgi:hypothetical protein